MSLTVYSKPNCPNCVTAKNLLKSKAISFTEIEVDYGQSTTNHTIPRTEFMEKFPAVRSLPHITEEDTNIGSLPQLIEFLK